MYKKFLRSIFALFILFSVLSLNTPAHAQNNKVDMKRDNANVTLGTIFGVDSRTSVYRPEISPNTSPIGVIETHYPSGAVREGTGYLIGDNRVVTAAHNVFNPTTRETADHLTFTPGRSSYNACPFGTAFVQEALLPSQFTTQPDFTQYDYAVLSINMPLGSDGLANHFDLRILSQQELANHPYGIIMGYPLMAIGQPTVDMWRGTGRLSPGISPVRVNYRTPTSPGQSGAPIILNDDLRHPIGIHTMGVSSAVPNYNSGIFFTQEIVNFLTQDWQNDHKVVSKKECPIKGITYKFLPSNPGRAY